MAKDVGPMREPVPETTRLGSYTIVRKLARGGMAELYLARALGPEGFEKLVVLKRVLPKYAGSARFVQLFLDEAKLAASLDHPNIVHVYDMGQIEGHYFFTMEYVHGQDLRAVLRRSDRVKRDTPVEHAVHIARDVAAALHYAHERRRPDGTLREIVHRDVSPSNILVSYDGSIKLADFGVAKAASSSHRTRTGTLKGKVGYMSPEQARGGAVDRRSDIFALGVVLWELLTVRRLFKAENDLATIQSIIHETAPPPSQLREGCPPELDRIVARALAKEPEARYQTAQQMQRDLEELAREVKLPQSSIALSGYLNELFEPEITSWREAQANGSTVTEILVAGGGPKTPVSESGLSLDFSEPSEPDEDDDELEEEAPDDPERWKTTLPMRGDPTPGDPPRASSPQGDEPTALAPPPLMAELMAAELDEVGSTTVASPPLVDADAATVEAPRYRDSSTLSSADVEIPTGITQVIPQRPPGIPPPPIPPASVPAPAVLGSAPSPVVGSGPRPATQPSSGVPVSSLADVTTAPVGRPRSLRPADLRAWYAGLDDARRRLVIVTLIAGGVVLLVVVIALIAGGGGGPVEPAR